jgi:hypothetical protein
VITPVSWAETALGSKINTDTTPARPDGSTTVRAAAGETLSHPPINSPPDPRRAMGECAPAAAAPTTAKTSVWWDIDKCAVPRGRCDPHRIAHNLIAALAAAGYVGPVSIAAYGDAARVPPPVLAALSATGICLNHVPAGMDPLPSRALHPRLQSDSM